MEYLSSLRTLALIVLTLFICNSSLRAEFHFPELNKEFIRPNGFLEINAYHDSRNQQVITEKHFIQLTKHLSYFGFTDFYIQIDGSFADFETYFTEHSIMLKILNSPFDFKTQWQGSSGDNNEIARFGLQTRVHDISFLEKLFKKINLKYNLTYYGFEINDFNQYVFQIQHIYSMKIFPSFFDNRLSIVGFHDDNFFSEGLADARKHVSVSELQLNYRLYTVLHAVIEARHNGFWAPGDQWGVGFGVKHKYTFN
jgi:hypothetical protein